MKNQQKRRCGIATSVDDVEELIESGYRFRLYLIPWGENSGAPRFIVEGFDDLERQFMRALEQSMYRSAVHVISCPSMSKFLLECKSSTEIVPIPT